MAPKCGALFGVNGTAVPKGITFRLFCDGPVLNELYKKQLIAPWAQSLIPETCHCPTVFASLIEDSVRRAKADFPLVPLGPVKSMAPVLHFTNEPGERGNISPALEHLRVAAFSFRLSCGTSTAPAERLISFAENMPEDMSPQLSREDRLCLLLCRGQLTLYEQARAREFLSAPLEWSLLLERAYTHGVYPLVYRNLRQLGLSTVPDMVQIELKRAYMANALRNQLLAEDLACLLRLLSHAGIPVIPLKGIALAESL